MNFSIRKDIRKLLVVTFVIAPLLMIVIGTGFALVPSLLWGQVECRDCFEKVVLIFNAPFMLVQVLGILLLWCKKFLEG